MRLSRGKLIGLGAVFTGALATVGLGLLEPREPATAPAPAPTQKATPKTTPTPVDCVAAEKPVYTQEWTIMTDAIKRGILPFEIKEEKGNVGIFTKPMNANKIDNAFIRELATVNSQILANGARGARESLRTHCNFNSTYTTHRSFLTQMETLRNMAAEVVRRNPEKFDPEIRKLFLAPPAEPAAPVKDMA